MKTLEMHGDSGDSDGNPEKCCDVRSVDETK
jgi:hypothetical protein